MSNFDDFYGVLSLNALKELAGEDRELIEQNEQYHLMNEPTIFLLSINDERSTRQGEQEAHKNEAKTLIRLWRSLGFRRASASSI